MKPNVIVALLVGLVLGFAAGKAASGPSLTKPGATSARAEQAKAVRSVDATVYKVPIEGSPTSGRADALVTLVEFSDYQCPYCSRANTTVEQLQKAYGDKLRVVMKEFPLSFHPNAKPSALAALAAGEQGKYWEMHELLFSNQRELSAEKLEEYAKKAGVGNLDQWRASLHKPEFESLIKRDTDQGAQLGVTGTPAFFVNGRRLSGAQPLDAFKALVDEELLKATALVRSGTPATEVYAKTMEKGTDRVKAPDRPVAAAPGSQVKNVDVPADSAIKGPRNAKVTVVEFSDFQCPFCRVAAQQLVKQIETAYPKDVRIVFRHEPLDMHPNARNASKAAIAAQEQGKFWEMHDRLFANQAGLDKGGLDRSASELGLNLARFKLAMDSDKTEARIKADLAAAASFGANGTPNFFINGRQVTGAVPFEQVKPVIDEEIAKADKLLASGVKLTDLYAKEVEANAKAAPSAPTAAAGVPTFIPVGTSPVRGPANAPVTIIEFSDFQCPFCGRGFNTMKQVEDAYRGKIKVAFKNQPLDMHANARPAAMAALAANEQGKFWEYHDKLFSHQNALDRNSLEQYAQELGLDMTKFKAALDTKKFEPQIAADSAEGTRAGAEGTPTFFVNGQKIVGAEPFETFKGIIDTELAKKPRSAGMQLLPAGMRKAVR